MSVKCATKDLLAMPRYGITVVSIRARSLTSKCTKLVTVNASNARNQRLLAQPFLLAISTNIGFKFRCETCGSAFSQAAHLKNHAKVHSGEKPFKCEICTAAFADRFALKRHRRIHEKYGKFIDTSTFPNSK